MSTEEQIKDAITWLDRLLVTRFKQSRKVLGNKENGFCCLGLGCHILGIDYNPSTGTSSDLIRAVGIQTVWEFIRLNDGRKYSFNQIAKQAIRNPDDFFLRDVARGITAHYA